MASQDGGAWDTLEYKRQMETMSPTGVPTVILDNNKQAEGIW